MPAQPKNFRLKGNQKRKARNFTLLRVAACIEARLAYYKKTELVLLNKVQSIRLGESLEMPIVTPKENNDSQMMEVITEVITENLSEKVADTVKENLGAALMSMKEAPQPDT